MALTEAEVRTYLAEMRSITGDLERVFTRAKRLQRKEAANGFYAAAMPEEEVLTQNDMQLAFQHVINDFVNYVDSGAVGTADRLTTMWKLLRATGL